MRFSSDLFDLHLISHLRPLIFANLILSQNHGFSGLQMTLFVFIGAYLSSIVVSAVLYWHTRSFRSCSGFCNKSLCSISVINVSVGILLKIIFYYNQNFTYINDNYMNENKVYLTSKLCLIFCVAKSLCKKSFIIEL